MNLKPLRETVKVQALRAEAWLFDQSLPFWARENVSDDGGFYERHDLYGRGIPGEDSRVRLQARQTYCFSLAAGLGWNIEQCEKLVQLGLKVLIHDSCRADGLFGLRVKPGEGLTDYTAETYDSAFALLAFSTAWQHLKIPAAYDAGARLSEVIEIVLRRSHSELNGYAERLPAPQRREQNPHMHLCEASLAWYEATGDLVALDRAKAIVGFVERTFWDEDLQVLKEYDALGDENHVEIGHMYEWVWILNRLKKLSGEPLLPIAGHLYESARRLESLNTYLPLASFCNGDVKDPRQRTWGLTEALKAHLAMAEHGMNERVLRDIANVTSGLFSDHLDQNIPGAWIDVISPSGDPLVKDITPATGYHIFLAFADLIAFSKAQSGNNDR